MSFNIPPQGTCFTGAIRVYSSGNEESIYLVVEHSGSSGPSATGRIGRSFVLHSTYALYKAGEILEHDEHAIWFMESTALTESDCQRRVW